MGTAVRIEAQAVVNEDQPHRSLTLHQTDIQFSNKNQQGTMGNLGMYASGVPVGMLIDARGPRWGVALGTVLFGAGYYPIAKGGHCR